MSDPWGDAVMPLGTNEPSVPDICYMPNCGEPARFTVNVGDEAGVALRRVCAKCYEPAD